MPRHRWPSFPRHWRQTSRSSVRAIRNRHLRPHDVRRAPGEVPAIAREAGEGISLSAAEETDTNVEQTERRATGNRRTLLTKPVAWVLSLEFVHEPKWTLHFCAVACSDVICCRF